MRRNRTPEYIVQERQARDCLPLSEATQFTLAILLSGPQIPYRVLREMQRLSSDIVGPPIGPAIGNYYTSIHRAEKQGLITYPEGAEPGQKGVPIQVTEVGKIALELQMENSRRWLSRVRENRRLASSQKR